MTWTAKDTDEMVGAIKTITEHIGPEASVRAFDEAGFLEQRRVQRANIEGAIKAHPIGYGKASGDAKLVAVRLAAERRALERELQYTRPTPDFTAVLADTALQTRLESLTEALINIAIGFFINFWGNWFILPLVGFTTLTVKDNFTIGLLFTVISVARQYAIRRWAQQHLRRAKVVTATYLGDLWKKFLAA